MLKICFWTTAFQADVLTLARRLCGDDRFDAMVVLDNPERFALEPVQRLLPVTCPLLDKNDPGTLKSVIRFAPEITVVDNHFPPERLSPYLFVLWHGFGWKGPNDLKEFKQVHKSIKRLTGERATRSNPYLTWQCFGPTDLDHRIRVSGFARENLESLGSAFTDDLVTPVIPREQALSHYPTSFAGKKVALVACTWHYGRVFSHWGDDLKLFRRLFASLSEKGCAAILRMHDKKRYETDYLRALEKLTAEQDDVLMKYKDRDRDSLLDMTISDLMVSNYSSILNYFYATKRPSIHIYPVKSGDETFLWRTWKREKVRVKKVSSARYVWKLPPGENGGITAHNFEELIKALGKGLSDPTCCERASTAFMEKHMAPVDGNSASRIAEALLRLARRPDGQV